MGNTLTYVYDAFYVSDKILDISYGLLGKVVKTSSHDPREEVNFYYEQLIDSKLLKKKI